MPVYEPSSTEDELRTRPRRPAELPAHLPDCDPLPLPLLLGLLYIFAFIIRIWTIAYPPLVVFDEVHFLRFIRAYYYGEYFFDIHPPLGKLVLLFVTRVFCGAPEREFARNGDAFGDQRYVPLRATSAIFGAMLAPLSYLVGREVGLSSWACMFASVAQIVEHLAVVEARLVLLDAQLMAWMATCLLLALRLWGRPPGKRWHLVIGTALTGAAALSVKWTSLATPALVALVSLLGAPFSSQGLHWNEIVVAGSMASSFYVLLFWIHFRLLPKSGQGDAFMRPGFQATLIGSKFYDKYARGPGFWRNFAYLNGVMYVANKGITTRHRWESRWWQWIINQRGLLFYNEAADNEEDDVMEKIYLIVNPAVTVITCIAMVTFMAACMIWLVRKWRRQIPSKKSIERRRMHAFVIRGMFFFCGYLFNLLPFLGMSVFLSFFSSPFLFCFCF